jgi:hypothetical protein
MFIQVLISRSAIEVPCQSNEMAKRQKCSSSQHHVRSGSNCRFLMHQERMCPQQLDLPPTPVPRKISHQWRDAGPATGHQIHVAGHALALVVNRQSAQVMSAKSAGAHHRGLSARSSSRRINGRAGVVCSSPRRGCLCDVSDRIEALCCQDHGATHSDCWGPVPAPGQGRNFEGARRDHRPRGCWPQALRTPATNDIP